MNNVLAALLGGVVAFSALAHGAHDIWAATLVYLAVLLLSSSFLILHAARPRSPGIHIDLAFPAGVVLVAFALSFLKSAHPSESLLELLDWTAAFLLFFLAQNIFLTEGARRVFLGTMVPVLWVQLVWHLLPRFSGPYFAETPGTLINPNLEAAFLLLWVPPLWSIANRPSRSVGRWFWWSGLGAALLSLVFTFSTWALVCLAVGALFEMARRNSGRAAHLRAGALLIFITALLVFKFLPAARGGIFAPYASTDRLAWWAAGLRMFQDHPWLGVGLGNYPSAYLAYRAGPVQNTLFPHSFMVGLLAETGIVGMGALVFFVVAWWRQTAAARCSEEGRPYFYGLLLFFLFSAASLGMEYLVNLEVCGIFSGIAVAVAGFRQKWKPRMSAALLVTALAVAAVPFIVSPFLASRNVVAGNEDLKAGNVDSALRLFSGAVDLDPLSSEAHRGWAAALRKKKDWEGAIHHQKRAVELDRFNPALHVELKAYLAGG